MTFSEYFDSITVSPQSINYNLCAKSGLPHFFEVLMEHDHSDSFMPLTAELSSHDGNRMASRN